MDASAISKVLSVLATIVSAQVIYSSGAIAVEMFPGVGEQSIQLNGAVSSPHASASGIATEIHQFVPPDTGGPDQTASTGTR
jgi:hypothetical protein